MTSLRLALLVLVALALGWAVRSGWYAPTRGPAPVACHSAEEIARQPPGTTARCCELAGANRSLGGGGDWESVVRWESGPAASPAPPCPCGCSAGKSCPDLGPLRSTAASSELMRTAPLARLQAQRPGPVDALSICHGCARGNCPSAPQNVPTTAVADPPPTGCVPVAECVKASDGRVLQICEWAGMNARFGGTANWEAAVVFDDPQGKRWAAGQRPACPCGCDRSVACSALASGSGLVAFCGGALNGGCPRSPGWTGKSPQPGVRSPESRVRQGSVESP